MKDKYAPKLKSLSFKLDDDCVPPSEELVAEFEQRFSLHLPADYREFLVQHGGATGEATCPFLESTPLGTSALFRNFYGFTAPGEGGDINDYTDNAGGAPDVIAIGDNLMGHEFWLMCAGPDKGSVYLHGHPPGSSWTNVVSSIFGRLKRAKKGRKREHIYLVAKSFTDFVDALQPEEEDEDKDAYPYPVGPDDALCVTTRSGKVDEALSLIEKGFDLEHRWAGMTALMWAVWNPFHVDKCFEIARILVKHGANVNAVNQHGYSVLSLAYQTHEQEESLMPHKSPCSELIAFLEQAGAKRVDP